MAFRGPAPGLPSAWRSRVGVRAVGMVLVGVFTAGCSLVEPVLVGRPAPASPAVEAPERWRLRFCEAQEWVAVSRIRLDEARSRVGRTTDREVLEDLGDDAADTAGRAEAFLRQVPAWDPGTFLVEAELALARRTMVAGDLLEEIAVTGPTTAARLRPARMALASLGGLIEAADEASRRAAAMGIPCAVPELAPLVPPEVRNRG